MMQTAQHWSALFGPEELGGFDPVLELMRGRIRMMRLCRAHLDDLGQFLNFMEETMGRRFAVFAPGCADRSFDEEWLCALFRAKSRADADSYRFLLRTRLSAEKTSHAHFLICRAQLSLELF